MSDNHPDPEPTQVTITVQESATLIDQACIRAKQQIYKIKDLIEKHPHDEVRQEARQLFDKAYEAFQALQTHITSR